VDKINFDDGLIAAIDKEMEWVEDDGSSPSKTAKDKGYHCKFMDGAFSATAWFSPDKLWSVCVIGTHGTIGTTLLAKSFKEVERLYRKLLERNSEAKKWQEYYSSMWARRYEKWVHKEGDECQLCRMGLLSSH